MGLKNSGGNSLPSFQAFYSMQANSKGDGFFAVESAETVRSTTLIRGNNSNNNIISDILDIHQNMHSRNIERDSTSSNTYNQNNQS